MIKGVVMCETARRSGGRNIPLMLRLEKVAEEYGVDLVKLASMMGIGWKPLSDYVLKAVGNEPDLKTVVRLCATVGIRNVDDLAGIGYKPRGDVDRRLLELQLGSADYDKFVRRMWYRLRRGMGGALRREWRVRPIVRSFIESPTTLRGMAAIGAGSILPGR